MCEKVSWWQPLPYSFLFIRKFCCNRNKMKVSKNFDEIRGKV